MAAVENLFSEDGRVYVEPKYITPLLNDIENQAKDADCTRTINENLIIAIKRNDVMRLSASPEISGINETIVVTADELRAIASRCTSTAWCLWNHLCTFHHFAALLGRGNIDFLW